MAVSTHRFPSGARLVCNVPLRLKPAVMSKT
jgi:hypothetical protein